MVIDLIVCDLTNFQKIEELSKAAERHENLHIRPIRVGPPSPFLKKLNTFRRPICVSGIDVSASRQKRFGVMIQDLKNWFKHNRPDYVMVVGDADSTAAAAIAAAKESLPIVHIGAGRRPAHMTSRTEEDINRILVDSVSSILYVTSQDDRIQLLVEGHGESSVVFIPNRADFPDIVMDDLVGVN